VALKDHILEPFSAPACVWAGPNYPTEKSRRSCVYGWWSRSQQNVL